MQTVPNSFWEWMNALGQGERLPVIILGLFALVFTVSIVVIMVYSMHKNKLEDALKRELLERGMSADEIATVIGAKSAKGCAKRLRNS